MLTENDILELKELVWGELSRIDEIFGRFQGDSVMEEKEKAYWRGILIKLDDMKESI